MSGFTELTSTLCAVSERLFSLLLHAYIGVLTAVEKRSVSQGQSGDVR
jgi:hypothetical protein